MLNYNENLYIVNYKCMLDSYELGILEYNYFTGKMSLKTEKNILIKGFLSSQDSEHFINFKNNYFLVKEIL